MDWEAFLCEFLRWDFCLYAEDRCFVEVRSAAKRRVRHEKFTKAPGCVRVAPWKNRPFNPKRKGWKKLHETSIFQELYSGRYKMNPQEMGPDSSRRWVKKSWIVWTSSTATRAQGRGLGSCTLGILNIQLFGDCNSHKGKQQTHGSSVIMCYLSAICHLLCKNLPKPVCLRMLGLHRLWTTWRSCKNWYLVRPSVQFLTFEWVVSFTPSEEKKRSSKQSESPDFFCEKIHTCGASNSDSALDSIADGPRIPMNLEPPKTRAQKKDTKVILWSDCLIWLAKVIKHFWLKCWKWFLDAVICQSSLDIWFLGRQRKVRMRKRRVRHISLMGR